MFLKVVIFLVAASACRSSRILVVFPTPDRSVSPLGDALVDTLLGAGHQVTYVSAFPQKAAENLTLVDVSSTLGGADAFRPDLQSPPLAPLTPRQALRRGVDAARQTLQHEAVQELMVDPAVQFDVVVAHWAHSTLLAPLGLLYGCPLVWYTAGDSGEALRLVHEGPSAAYSAGHYAYGAPSHPFTIRARALQLWQQLSTAVVTRYYTDFIELPLYESLYGEALRQRGVAPAPYELVVGNASLLLVGSHPPLGQPLPLPLNARLVGGHHLQLPDKPLPKKYQAFLDSAQHGVILIDLGANVRSEDIPKHVRSRLLEMFEQLQQFVVWRLDAPPPHRPVNVRVLATVPAQGTLCHPNTRLLITDGSTAALTEAVHCEVPVVVVPLAGDQFLSADLAVAQGFARRVDFSHHLAWKLQEAIRDILANYSSYRTSSSKASTLFNLRPVPAQDELLHWVHVATITGAHHLRSPAIQLTLTERYHLDLWFLAALAVWFLTKVVKVIRVHMADEDDDKKNN